MDFLHCPDSGCGLFVRIIWKKYFAVFGLSGCICHNNVGSVLANQEKEYKFKKESATVMLFKKSLNIKG